MFQFSLSLLLVVVTSRLSVQALFGHPGYRCPLGWQCFQGSCYAFGRSLETWSGAQSVCTAHGGKLVEIENEQENDFLRNISRSMAVAHTWLGATDVFKENNWTWASERRLIGPFTNWGPGQPSNYGGNQHCLEFWSGNGYLWDDYECYEKGNYICEARATPGICI